MSDTNKTREEIMRKHIQTAEGENGIEIFFAYKNAMQEFADLQTSHQSKEIEELKKENERLKNQIREVGDSFLTK